MAERVFTSGLLYCGALALQAQTREMALVVSSELQDTTAWDDTARNRLGGLKDVSFSAAGYYAAAEPDASLFANIAVADTLITVCPGGAVAEVSYFFRALLGEYAPLNNAVGEVAGFTLNASAYADALIRGTLLENGSFTVTGNGTGRQLGAVSSSQRIYAGLHITAITGDWTIVLESDDNSGFTSATTRATFSNQTAVGDLFTSVAGAIADTYWRFRFTENSAGTITLAASLGIQ